DARAQLRGLHDAAVEQHGRWHAAEPPEELREVARDRRVVGVRQAELAQAAGAAALGLRFGADLREEAVDEQRLGGVALDDGLLRPADELRAAPEDRDGHRLRRLLAEQLLLRSATGLHERALLERIEAELAPGERGEREVHVVAAEQDVIADGD